MNVEFFIARRIFSSQHKKDSGTRSGTRPIIAIATGGIAIGIAVMILASFIVKGFQTEIRAKVIGFGAHIQITNFDASNSLEPDPIARDQPFYPALTEVPGIRHIQVYANKGGIIKTEDQIQGVFLKGVGPDFDWDFFRSNLQEGETLTTSGEKKSNEILLSSMVAKRLKLAVGDTVRLFFVQQPIRIRELRIAGLYATNMEKFDNMMALCDIRHIQRLNGWTENEVSGFEVLLDGYEELVSQKDFVHGHIGPGLMATSIADEHREIFSWLEIQDINVYFIIGLMILVASINMVSALLILILDRTRMIGMLKALGARDASIQTIFVYNGAFIIARGLLWGNVLGIGLALLQYNFGLVKLPAESYYLDTVPIFFDIPLVLLLNAGTLLLCTLVLFLPSLLVQNISPVQAIRLD